MNLHQLQQLNINNLAYDTAYFARKIKGMRVKETLDYIIVDSGLPTFNFNIITLLHPFQKDSQESLLAEIKAFNDQKIPINIWCYEHHQQAINILKNMGLQEYQTTYVAMVAHLNSIKVTTKSQNNLLIKKVSTPNELYEFSKVLTSLYDDPLEKKSIREYYRQVGQLPKSSISDTNLYIGVLHEKFVSIGALTHQENTIGMYHIATLQNYRGQGLATEMVHFLLKEVKKSGATYCTLQSSPDGKNIYEKFGYYPVGTLKVFENQHLIISEK